MAPCTSVQLNSPWPRNFGLSRTHVEMYLYSESRRENGRCLAIRLRSDSSLVGTAALLVPHPVGCPWIGLLMVHGSHQGRGLGGEVARGIEIALRQEGWMETRLSVLKNNERALPFWQHLGYRIIEEKDDTAGRPCWVLAKRILEQASSQGSEPLIPSEADHLCSILKATPWLMHALEVVRRLELPDWAIAAGAIRNAVWDHLHGHALPTPLRDVDVVFFDPADVSEARDHRLEKQLQQIRPSLPWEVTNQASVHLWFPKVFGYEVPSFHSTEEAVAHNPETATSVGARLGATGSLEILAPCGLSDLLGMVLRHNRRRATRDLYLRRLEDKRIADVWPRARIIVEEA
jgi:RimJ/RimL family protein N-acetyltransferase